jgi:asparagine synthase (glutamine-hydrolysing)
MCGFAGFKTTASVFGNSLTIAKQMGDALSSRGPDDSGEWEDQEGGMVFAHRRLAVIELSVAGHQPMLSASGRWVLAYNGEVYNHLELRHRLEAEGAAPAWRGHSDTETLLAAIDAWGVDETLKRSAGMFALAVWDRSERALWLARDRIGEKPLYYGWQGGTFLFGSELKALRAHPCFNAEVDRGALALLLRHNYVPGPCSIYAGIRKLSPGTWLKLGSGQRDVQPVAYWSLAEVAERGTAQPFVGSETDAVDALDQYLGHAVRGQMMADVPLGAMLSGGIDSSLIAALMQAGSARPVRTFTIGFDEKAYDEASHARAVAAHLGTDHTELRLSANDALALIPELPAMYDEPFADSSQLPTHMVMKLARQHVTVALSGDAGDEFFSGYNRYVLGPKVWQKIGWMPSSIRASMLRFAGNLPAVVLDRLGTTQSRDKMQKLARLFSAGRLRDIDDLYRGLVTEWPAAASMVVNGHIPANLLDQRECWPKLADPVARMMAMDGLTYLPDDILVKVDRASMAVSLETRAPFLDRRVMEFAWSLPMSMKLRDGRGKWILRQLLDRYVPRALIERPKMGFSIPLDAWLRGPLREWAESLLAEDRLRREGYFDPKPIRLAWMRHVRGEASFGYRLWSVLMFQAWLEHQGKLV